MDQNKLSLDTRHLGVPSGVPKIISMPIVHSAQTVHQCSTEINTISKLDRNELPLNPHHLGVPTGVPKMSSMWWYVRRKPCTYLAPRLTLSPNGPKQASLDIHYLGVPSGVPNAISMPVVHSSQTVRLSCTRLKLSPNGMKWASAWPTSPMSTIRCVQNDFQAYGTFGAIRAAILRRD
jgi:hypothetical protein